ncbi:hypothetical protein H2199_003896 [Coniosporium tulheliwenetii]|uniref:Uncharacterized protein n=1 Tax=Coniosporium tulheliwenetii TaxID=3383036 RepID=A0ACC2Z9Q8_9PEZI|nr:hypothetical protein H2199_003896 [Cladosporium sp. JES 115]
MAFSNLEPKYGNVLFNYATARDEFEIAAEETEKQTVYAEDDRAAAREELEKLKAVYQEAITGPDKALAEEVERRAGGRIRELENAVRGWRRWL